MLVRLVAKMATTKYVCSAYICRRKHHALRLAILSRHSGPSCEHSCVQQSGYRFDVSVPKQITVGSHVPPHVNILVYNLALINSHAEVLYLLCNTWCVHMNIILLFKGVGLRPTVRTRAGVWRETSCAFPDSNSVLD